MELKISIVTCSDTRDLAQDEAGAALEELIEAQGWTVASHVVVRDDVSEIGDAIVEAADECHANVATRSYTCRKLSRFHEGRPRKLGGHSGPAGARVSDDSGRRTYQLSYLPAVGRPYRSLRFCFPPNRRRGVR